MRHSLFLLPLLAASAAAQTSQPAAVPTPAAQPDAILTTKGTLAKSAFVPVVLSPDGKSLLYVKAVRVPGPAPAPGRRPRSVRRFVYVRCDADGKAPTEVLTTGVNSDDVLTSYSAPAQFSPDGSQLVLPTTSDGKPTRGAPVSAVVLSAGGEKTPVTTQLPWAMGFGYAKNQLVVLEGHGFRGRQTGYRLVAWTGKTPKLIEESATAFSFLLRISPDGSKAALLLADPASRMKTLKIRVVDLKTKQAVESSEFRSDDVTFDGPPVIHWDATGAGVYFHAIPPGGGKRDFTLSRFDVAKKRSAPVIPFKAIGVTAVLDADHLAVIDRVKRGAAILRLSDQAVFPIPGRRSFVAGGRRTRLVIHGRDPQTRKEILSVATFTLPTANPTGK